MAVENVIIGYKADISDIERKLRSVQTLNRRLAQGTGKDFTKGFTVVSNELKKISTVSKAIKLPKFGATTNEVRSYSTVLKDANGSLFTVNRSIAGTGDNIKQMASSVRAGANVTRTFGDNLKTLGTRALLTIPVWFALRNSIFGTFRAIQDGLGSIASFDRALQKLKRNVSATSNTVEADFNNLKNVIEEFSLESGVSVDKITSAIQKFATVGFDIETSLTGGIQATKLAVNLFGDAEETANAFARSMRVLTEDMDSVEQKQKAISEALALTDQLWQTNAFEVNEFSGNLEKFAGTAKIANLSIEDTLTLLATLSTGGLGNRAGRLLRSTLLKALADIENVTRTLNLNFDPNNQPTIVFIQELIKSLKDLRSTEGVPAELAETLGDLFTIRSTEVLSALTALEGTLKDNIALVPDLQKFEQTFEEQTETINRLVERHKNLNKEMARAFATGLFGGENYNDLLTKIVATQEKLNGSMEKFGGIIRNVLIAGGIASVIAFRGQLLKTLAILKSPAILGGVAVFQTLSLVEQVNNLAKEEQKAGTQLDALGKNMAERIKQGLSGNLNFDDLTDLIQDIELKGELLGFQPAQLNKAKDLLSAIREETERITVEEQKQAQAQKDIEVSNQRKKKIAELVLKTELDIARAQGATVSEIISLEQSARKRLGIEKEILAQVEDQLAKEKALNEEKRLQANVGSDSLKLFKIAKTEGVGVAKVIGDVLAGQIDFNSFVRRGGKELEVFKKEYGSIFEAKQAEAFFKGQTIPDLRGLRGGAGVRTEENFGQGTTVRDVSESQRRAERIFGSLQPNVQQEQVSALEKNTQSLDQLRKLYESGATLRGEDASRFIEGEAHRQQNIQSVARRVAPQRQVFDLNVNVDGKNLTFSGSLDSVSQLAESQGQKVLEEVARQLSQRGTPLNKSLKNALIGKQQQGL